ncbi:hypothetical protein AB4574_26550, partial [Vibrio sp. 10N.222.49.E5]|uniref:hypothetical protein n=1 Tax=Vibrio sp. 10N.222.49.E5 TaxID=3229617 RepID=UPI0035521D34
MPNRCIELNLKENDPVNNAALTIPTNSELINIKRSLLGQASALPCQSEVPIDFNNPLGVQC